MLNNDKRKTMNIEKKEDRNIKMNNNKTQIYY